jgi:hypothetical protein
VTRYIPPTWAGGFDEAKPPGRARSSAGEHSLDMGGVTGSIPVVPTIYAYQRVFIASFIVGPSSAYPIMASSN